MILMLIAIAILLILNAYLLQDIRDLIKKQNEVVNRPKQFKREHSNVSKTNFRKYIEWTNRCVC